MASLSKSDYLLIAGYLSDVRTSLDTLHQKLYNCADIVVHSDEFDVTLDLMNTFYNTYLTQTVAYDSNAPFLDMIRAVNRHVLQRNNYTTLAQFLGASTVTQNWADMSAEVGNTIDEANIE